SHAKTDAEPRRTLGAVVSVHGTLQPGTMLFARTEVGGVYECAGRYYLRRRPGMSGGKRRCQRTHQPRSARRICLQCGPEVCGPWWRRLLLHDPAEPDFQRAEWRRPIPAAVSVDRQY